ncbi:magnesium-transporting ATPase (P-type) [Chryseobacterium defluvii]|uniref:Magnesium-transporting ATPase (P-type) n=1 Tax=Chryseobacterium defluvii TaxID=160396 RepID=A0A840KDP3_9FLAO|nr:hypothetical protein [Chryseobacterium defluvii]MBB4805663.1 magnesium-transporting ATPase (P-type) [Chryseobacterium defluvii]
MEEQSAFEEFDVKTGPIRRRSLLPLWIKIFLWIFLIMGSIAVLIFLCGLFMDDVELSIYGIEANHPYTISGLIVSILMICKGIVAYGLWFEQDWAPKAAIIDAVAGIIICSAMMMIIPFISDAIKFSIRLELIPLIFYLIDMRKIEKKWNRV